MSLSLAKKSLSFIESSDEKSHKNNKSNKIKKSKKKKIEESTDSHTENIVKTLLSYNTSKFDEKTAKKILRHVTKKKVAKLHKPEENPSQQIETSIFTEQDFQNFEEEYKRLMNNQ